MIRLSEWRLSFELPTIIGFGDIVGNRNVANYRFATWAGDLGSSVAKKVIDERNSGSNLPWKNYFRNENSLSAVVDLNGDIDALAIH